MNSVAGFDLYHYRATLLRVVDGDTIRVQLSLGLRISRDVSLRIAGINTPEINRGTAAERAAGDRARLALVNLIGPEGTPLYVRTYKDTQSFDRYVCDLLVGGPDGMLVNVAEAMVESGYAIRATR